jgi:hypothetical protein
MPQPLYPQPPIGTFVHRPRILASQRPLHAAGIAAVTSEWAALEDQLIQTLARSLFAFSKEGGYAIATTILEAVESTSIRLEAIAALLETRIPPEDFKFFSENLRPEIRKRASERNKVAHNNWFVHDGYPEHLITLEDGRYVKYSVQDFTDIADRIIAATTRVTVFLVRFHRWDGIGPWNSMHDPEPN